MLLPFCLQFILESVNPPDRPVCTKVTRMRAIGFLGLIYLQLTTYGFLHGQTVLEISVKAEKEVSATWPQGGELAGSFWTRLDRDAFVRCYSSSRMIPIDTLAWIVWARRPQPHTENCVYLRNAENGRPVFAREAHQWAIQYHLVSPETIHASHI